MTVLAFARAQSYEAASNLRGEQADTTWLFLLPRLDLRRVACLGTPPRGTLTALRALAGEVEVVDPGADQPGRADLVYVTAGWTGSEPEAPFVYREPPARLGATEAETVIEIGPGEADAPPPAGGGRAAWVIPAAPARTPGRPVRLLRRVAARAPGRRARPQAAGLLGYAGAPSADPSAPAPRSGVLLRPAGDPSRLPDYVLEAARSAGADLDGARWRIAPPRGYRSQKVVFTVDDGGPPAIVKVTQDRRFNERLANEHDALAVLDGLLPESIAPRALFRAEHAGLLLVGETRLPGIPFRAASDATPGCPVARAVLDAIGRLGAAGRRPVGPADLTAALEQLAERHRALHAPRADRLRALEGSLAALGEAAGDLSPTFLHGDVSTLNLLVDGERIGFVDWENAEPAGLPAWDHLYFLNAFSAWGAERRGRRSTPGAIVGRLATRGPYHRLLVDALDRSEVPRALRGPLSVAFWMQLALREATRLPEGGAAGGLYARVLARWLDALADVPSALTRA